MEQRSRSTMADPAIMGILGVLAAVALLASTGCRDAREVVEATGDMRVVVEANNAFALDLYAVEANNTDGNLFFSPFSIHTAFSMVTAGAEGDTLTQLQDTLGIVDIDSYSWHANLGLLNQDLAGQHHRNYTLYTANSVWGQTDEPFVDDYVATLEESYDAPLQQWDFKNDPAGALNEVNGWVEETTQGYIQDLMSGGDINGMTRLVLANAIFFDADWATQFETADTRDQAFTLSDGSTVDVEMMRQTSDLRYGSFDGVQVLEMLYKDDEVSMVVLLPEATDGIKDLEAQLTQDNLDEWIGSLGQPEVMVNLPRFTIEYELPLADDMAALGVVDAFDPVAANFDGIVAPEDRQGYNMYIGAARHKAYVEVDEEGTVAAAATGISMDYVLSASDSHEFIADHPFILIIRDTLTGAILFMGRIEDPRG